MKYLFSILILITGIAAVKVQNSVKGKLMNGTVVEIINSKGELVYGNTSAAETALTIKSFTLVAVSKSTELKFSPAKGSSTLTGSDINAINSVKGARALVTNIVAVDNNGKETKLPDIQFFIE
ncbi:MAG: hypothetical protein AB1458_06590 [Bacteroidota bacterium]